MPKDNRSAMRKTIVARIATFDTSIPNPTPEQVAETIRLLDSAIEVFDGQPDGKTLMKLRGEVAKLAQSAKLESAEKDNSSPPVQSSTQVAASNGAIAEDSSVNGPEEGQSQLEVQSAMGGGKVKREVSPGVPYTSGKNARRNAAEEDGPMRETVDTVLDALPYAENSKDNQRGDQGRALGRLQQWEINVKEANRLVGKPMWTMEDRADPIMSRAMAKVILEHHFRLGYTDPVTLGGKWRNPYTGEAPEWYLNKVREGLSTEAAKRVSRVVPQSAAAGISLTGDVPGAEPRPGFAP